MPVSSIQDFLNNVCTHIVHLTNKKLNYYTGNYDTFVQTREEVEENQMKRFNWEQEQIKNMKVSVVVGYWRLLCHPFLTPSSSSSSSTTTTTISNTQCD